MIASDKLDQVGSALRHKKGDEKRGQSQSWSCGHCRSMVVLGQYLMVLGQYRAVWVSIRQHRLLLDGTGSLYGDSGWYLVVIGQYRVVLVGTWSC